MPTGENLPATSPSIQRSRNDGARKRPTSLKGKGFMRKGYQIASGADSVASGLTMGTAFSRASLSTAASMSTARAARKKSLAGRGRGNANNKKIVSDADSVASGLTMGTAFSRISLSTSASMATAKAARKKSLAERGNTNNNLTEKALARRRKKMDKIAGGAGAEIVLETAPNDPIVEQRSFDTLSSKSSPSDEGQHHSRIDQTTPSTASLSCNEDNRSDCSFAALDKYAMSCPDSESPSTAKSSNAHSGRGGLPLHLGQQHQTQPNKSTFAPLRPRSLGAAFDAEDQGIAPSSNNDRIPSNNKLANDNSASNSSRAATAITSKSKKVEYLAHDMEYNKIRHHTVKEWDGSCKEGDTLNKHSGMSSGANGSAICSMSEAYHENAINDPGGETVMPHTGSSQGDDSILKLRRQSSSISMDSGWSMSPMTEQERPTSPMTEHEWEGAASHTSNITTPLVDAETEHMLDTMRKQMPEPNQQVADLLTTIHRPLEDSGVTMNRGYMTRRKNACGALKVMASKKSSRVEICWIKGVLTSLTTVLNDSGNGNLEEEYPDNLTRLAYIEARKRAVATLLYLTTPTENRIIVFHSPGLIRALGKVIHEDEGECRQGCCAIIAYLAKTSEIRLLMAQFESIIDAVALTITPKTAPAWDESMSETKPIKVVDDYDRDPNQYLHESRACVFATLLRLSKEKENTFYLARNKPLINALISVSDKHTSPSHVRAITILANLTRNKDNASFLVFHVRPLLPMIVRAMQSVDGGCRRHALYALWNLSYDVACRHEIANAHNLLAGLCECAIKDGSGEEQLAASGTLKNLSDEPSNLIPMTNAPQCVATLMELTNVKGGKLDMVQYNACDALATLSHWLRKLATGAVMIGAHKDSSTNGEINTLLGQNGLYCPQHLVATYSQFE